jgi:hypothetical protein
MANSSTSVRSARRASPARRSGRGVATEAAAGRTDYELKLPNGRIAALNVCKSLVADVWNPRVDRKSDIAGRVRGEHGDFALGYVNTTLAVRDGMPVLVYEGGSKCPKTDFMFGSAVIRFICDKDVYGAGTGACWLGCAAISRCIQGAHNWLLNILQTMWLPAPTSFHGGHM